MGNMGNVEIATKDISEIRKYKGMYEEFYDNENSDFFNLADELEDIVAENTDQVDFCLKVIDSSFVRTGKEILQSTLH